jgi:L-threonylcarbamoyladenylate synthase
MADFRNDIEQCIKILSNGGLILYPTDTIWGIGSDATNFAAVQKIFSLKKRKDSKSMIALISDEIDITRYVKADAEILNYVSTAHLPVTAVYEDAKNVAANMVNEDGTIAIRIVKDEFCAALIKKFSKPIVSTSANISGMPPPANFKQISDEIKNGVDYIVQHRRGDFKAAKPSTLIKMDDKRNIIILRP